MRKLSKLLAGTVSALAAATLIAGTVTAASAAPNDPPKGITPQSFDIVGVGSNTTQYVIDQIAVNYNSTVKVHNAKHPWLFSWDAVPPGSTSSKPTKITPKAGCPIITRPNGSTSGWQALAANEVDGKTGHFCVDFSRSSGARNPKAPGKHAGGLVWVAFAKDAITWATRSAAAGGTDAPANLTLPQLQGIFTCKTTNWKQVGGKNAAIKVYLPQPGSGTLATWEKFMGITTLGSCVSQAPEENEGTFAGFKSPNAVFIYSIGAYISQKFHSAACGKTPKPGQNMFGCNTTGVLVLKQIGGVNPTTSAKVPVINPNFPKGFFRTVYNVVRFAAHTSDNIPAYLEPLFGKNGFLCKSAAAKKDVVNYGFIVTSTCGSTS